MEEALGLIGLIVLIVIAFVVFGLLGWVLKLGGFAFDFLGEGCSTSWGCLIWIIAILVALGAVMG